MDKLLFGVSAAGDPVAECVLGSDELELLPELAEAAVRGGAARLWVHCAEDLREDGFTACEGFRSFVLTECPAGDPLPVLDAATVRALLPRAHIGQWGHKQVTDEFLASSELTYVGLGGPGEWTGLCGVDIGQRVIDGPGFVDVRRTDAAVERMVLGACALVGEGPIAVHTWGEPAAPYLAMGFSIATEDGGWERILAAA